VGDAEKKEIKRWGTTKHHCGEAKKKTSKGHNKKSGKNPERLIKRNAVTDSNRGLLGEKDSQTEKKTGTTQKIRGKKK